MGTLNNYNRDPKGDPNFSQLPIRQFRHSFPFRRCGMQGRTQDLRHGLCICGSRIRLFEDRVQGIADFGTVGRVTSLQYVSLYSCSQLEQEQSLYLSLSLCLSLALSLNRNSLSLSLSLYTSKIHALLLPNQSQICTALKT